MFFLAVAFLDTVVVAVIVTAVIVIVGPPNVFWLWL